MLEKYLIPANTFAVVNSKKMTQIKHAKSTNLPFPEIISLLVLLLQSTRVYKVPHSVMGIKEWTDS